MVFTETIRQRRGLTGTSRLWPGERGLEFLTFILSNNVDRTIIPVILEESKII